MIDKKSKKDVELRELNQELDTIEEQLKINKFFNKEQIDFSVDFLSMLIAKESDSKSNIFGALLSTTNRKKINITIGDKTYDCRDISKGKISIKQFINIKSNSKWIIQEKKTVTETTQFTARIVMEAIFDELKNQPNM